MTDWNKNLPAGNQDISIGDDNIRDNNQALEERMSQEHYFPENANTNKWGRHKFPTGTTAERGTKVPDPDVGMVYWNTDTSAWEVYTSSGWASTATRLVGEIISVGYDAYTSTPALWLPCDGREVAKATYAALYAVLGDRWNDDPDLGLPADATNNFRVPNRGGRVGLGMVAGGDTDGDYDFPGPRSDGSTGSAIGTKTHTLSGDESPLAEDFTGTTAGSGSSGLLVTGGSPFSVNTEGHSHQMNHGHANQASAVDGHETRQPSNVECFLIYAGV